jgi:hypothetical protein
MAYNITLTNGSALITGGLVDGTIDITSTSLTLVGKNYPGYGIFLNQNMVRLMENFSNTAAPGAPLPGQLWWNSSTKYLNINTATTKGTANAVWKTIATMTYAGSFTTTPVAGEQWFDTVNQQLKVWNGTAWVVIGPVSATALGNTGAIPDTLQSQLPGGGAGPTYVVLKFFIDGTLVGIWSKDTQFNTAISGFATVSRGLNLNTDLNQQFYGNTALALALSVSGASVPGTSFLRNDQSGTINGFLVVDDDNGITVGEAGEFVASVDTGVVRLRNTSNNKDLILGVRKAGVDQNVLKLNFDTGLPEAYSNPVSSSPDLSLATKFYVDRLLGGGTFISTFNASLNPAANVTFTLGNTTNRWSNVFTQSMLIGNVYAANTFTHQSNITGTVFVSSDIMPVANTTSNLGSLGMWFNTIHGKSVQAQYADLAERFEADMPYDPGTVVAIGGLKEITAEQNELSEDVFGVISTRAAYLMNGAAGPNSTHPPVAVNGRVPVKVIGRVRKGDRLVSAGNGLARAGAKHELSPWNVIGRSLEDKLDSSEGIVEAIVKLNS